MEACDSGRTALSWDGCDQVVADSVIHHRNMILVMNISSAIAFFGNLCIVRDIAVRASALISERIDQRGFDQRVLLYFFHLCVMYNYITIYIYI